MPSSYLFVAYYLSILIFFNSVDILLVDVDPDVDVDNGVDVDVDVNITVVDDTVYAVIFVNSLQSAFQIPRCHCHFYNCSLLLGYSLSVFGMIYLLVSCISPVAVMGILESCRVRQK